MVELFAYSIVHAATKGALNRMNTTILTRVPAGTWNLDPVHSRVGFEVHYLAGAFKGVTKPVAVTGTVTAPLQDAYGNDRIGLNLTTTVDRTDFGVSWNAPLPSGDPALANEVTILADLQFVKPGGETAE